jgi:orotate phosphoribosyltransferase
MAHMFPTLIRQPSIEQQLSALSAHLLFSDLGTSDSCKSSDRLAGAAWTTFNRLDPALRTHLGMCPRCAHRYATLRAYQCLRRCPDKWPVVLQSTDYEFPADDRELQLLGFIDIESKKFQLCRDESEWTATSSGMRINIVIDKATDLFAVTILDAPHMIHSISVVVPDHALPTDRVDDPRAFECVDSLSRVVGISDSDAAGDKAFKWFNQGLVSVVIEKHSVVSTHEDFGELVRTLLYDLGAVETDCDYELPSGLHSDTYINVGKLCSAEEALSNVALALDSCFSDVSFDTIATNGWAMAMIARRLASIRSKRGAIRIQDVICEGYEHLTFAGDILPHSKTLVLVDVNVTGSLVTRLANAVRRINATVVGMGALVYAVSSVSKRPQDLRYLADIELDVVSPIKDQCPRCDKRPLKVFNPVAQCMTQRAPFPRSPTEFLTQNSQAREFWDFVNVADAYEHHRKEDDTHYLAFVDTKKLLDHARIGSTLVNRLRDRILLRSGLPFQLLIPDRPRSKTLAAMLCESFKKIDPSSAPEVIVARRSRTSKVHPATFAPWHISPQEAVAMKGRLVLVIDTAAGHGRTLDNLTCLAADNGAKSVGAAVLLSRLTETCEQAFDTRLTNGFSWLFHFPIRPVVIRGPDVSLCPVCRRRAALKAIADRSPSPEVRQWCEYVVSRIRIPRQTVEPPENAERQLSLFPQSDEFIRSCRSSVASGVTLHALNAAMNNGMAPLTLPELTNANIPVRNRAAMIENLPQSAIEWSGEVLLDDLREFLAHGDEAAIWRASADALARAGSNEWLSHIEQFLDRLGEHRRPASPSFWNNLACTGCVTAAGDAGVASTLKQQLGKLLDSHSQSAHAVGLKVLIDAICE